MLRTLVSYHPDISQIRGRRNRRRSTPTPPRGEHAARSDGLTSSQQDDFQIINASSIASAVSSTSKTLTNLMAAIGRHQPAGRRHRHRQRDARHGPRAHAGDRRAEGDRRTRRHMSPSSSSTRVVISLMGGILWPGGRAGRRLAGGSAPQRDACVLMDDRGSGARGVGLPSACRRSGAGHSGRIARAHHGAQIR